MRCARLSAPFVTALCIFDTLRGGSAARRSRPLIGRARFSPFIDNPRRNASSPATPLLARGRLRSLPCLRLVAPVENRARLGFAPLASRVFALPRCSRVVVSCRAYSSPAPQPASRHSIKPLFDVQVGCDHRARRGRVGAPRRPLVLVVFKNSTLQLQLSTPTQTLVNVAIVEMLPIPIPIPNWKLGTHFVRRVRFPTGREPPQGAVTATLELDIFTLATFTNSNSNTQKPKHSNIE